MSTTTPGFRRSLHSLIKHEEWDDAMTRLGTQWGRFEARKLCRVSLLARKPTTTVLHLACKYKPPLHLVEALVDIFPEALTMRCQPLSGGGGARETSLGYPPLHVACCRGASWEVVETLLQECPHMLDKNVVTLAMKHGASSEVVDVLERGLEWQLQMKEEQDEETWDTLKFSHERRRRRRRSCMGPHVGPHESIGKEPAEHSDTRPKAKEVISTLSSTSPPNKKSQSELLSPCKLTHIAKLSPISRDKTAETIPSSSDSLCSTLTPSVHRPSLSLASCRRHFGGKKSSPKKKKNRRENIPRFVEIPCSKGGSLSMAFLAVTPPPPLMQEAEEQAPPLVSCSSRFASYVWNEHNQEPRDSLLTKIEAFNGRRGLEFIPMFAFVVAVAFALVAWTSGANEEALVE